MSRRRLMVGGKSVCVITLKVSNASDATITLNGSSTKAQSKSIEVEKGSTVTWKVARANCVTQSGSLTASEDTTKTITLKGNYTIYTDQGEPDVYFDGVKRGTVSNGSFNIKTLDWKRSGYSVELKNCTTKPTEVITNSESVGTGVEMFELYGEYKRLFGNVGFDFYYFEVFVYEPNTVWLYNKYNFIKYTCNTSGTITGSLTLNYSIEEYSNVNNAACELRVEINGELLSDFTLTIHSADYTGNSTGRNKYYHYSFPFSAAGYSFGGENVLVYGLTDLFEIIEANGIGIDRSNLKLYLPKYDCVIDFPDEGHEFTDYTTEIT